MPIEAVAIAAALAVALWLRPWRLLAGGRFGLLVPPGDEAALAAAVGSLLADPARAHRLGEAARRHTVEHYGREAMVRRFEALYERLTSPERKRGAAA